MRSDAELVNACLEGSKEAFADLVRRYQKPVRAVAVSILRDYHLAADTCQDAFVTAYENLPSLRKRDAFGPWLMKITRRCAFDSARDRPKTVDLESAASAVQGSDGRLDPDNEKILAAVMKLPESERHVTMLRYFSGHAVKDIAEITGSGIGTVTKQLSRAHQRLRKILGKAEL